MGLLLITLGRTSVEKIAYACHVAYLDPMTGSGLLVRPNPEDDIATPVKPGEIPQCFSMHEADWNSTIRDLYARGWEPSDDGEDGLALDSMMPDGREVIGLYGRDSVIEKPTIEEIAASFAELRKLAGSIVN